MMCRVLGVSTSGFYAWRSRGHSTRAAQDERLTKLIVSIHDASRRTYGSPRVHAELRLGHGISCGRKRVARLMREAGLVGAHRRRRRGLTRRQAGAIAAPDRLERKFIAGAPNRVWVADITYVPTRRGFVYLAVILDLFSRAVVGWSTRSDLSSELVLEALDAALERRRPEPGLIHHSDHGCQFTSMALGRRLEGAGLVASMGSIGDCYDNAVAESFFATLECELLADHRFDDHTAARLAIFEFIEVFYNRARRHSSLDYLCPADYERRHEHHLEPVH